MTLAHVETTGAMPGGEAFSFGWWEERTEATAQAAATAIKNLGTYQNILIQLGNLNGPGVALQTLYVRYYNVTGGAATDTGQVGLGDVDVTYNGSDTCPNQTALCVTIRSASPGPSGRNRFYLPATSPGGLAAGKISGSVAQAVASRVESYFNAVTPVVYSGKFHTTHPVSSVTCGDVLDSQNGRRRGLKEDRYVGAVIGP